MNKKLQFKSLLLLTAMLIGASSAWAGDIVYKSLTFPDDNSTNNGLTNKQYESTWTAKIGNDSWSISNFNNNNWNNNWEFIKCGRKKSGNNYNPSIATITTAQIDKAITKVVVSLTAINKNDYNSIKLYVASNAAFSDNLTTITATIPSAAGDMTIAVPETNQAENRYYKLEFDTKGSTSGNGHTGISKVDYYIYQASTKTETSLEWSENTYSFYQDEDYTLPTLTANPEAITEDVSYSSSNETVATVTDGTINIVGPGSTTITASYAGNDTYEAAAEAKFTLTVYGCYTKFDDVHNAATGQDANVKYTFANEYVTFVSNDKKTIYISDGTNGMALYSSTAYTSTTIVAGAKLVGSIKTTLTDYRGTVEFKDIPNDNLAALINGSQENTASTKTIDAITKTNQSVLVKLEGVTYDATSEAFTDGDNSINFSKKFYSANLTDNATYDIVGVIIMNSNEIYIAPRSADDISLKSSLETPTCLWKDGNEELTSITIMMANGAKKFTFETNSNGAVTYTSSNEAVATIENDGTITPLAYGTTTITANVAQTTAHYAASKSFTLTISDNGLDILTAQAIGKTTYDNWSNLKFATNAVYAGNSTSTNDNTIIQMQGKDNSGIVTTTTGGRAKKITITWNNKTPNPLTSADQVRTLDIYGKNTPYQSSADLYSNKEQGTKIGSFTYDGETNTESLAISTNFAYIGIRSYDGALYLDNIAIEWDETVQVAPEVTIGESKLATFAHSKAVDFADTGVTICIVNVDGNVAKLTPIRGTIVPANTGVILTAENAGSYAGVITTGEGSLDGNEMVGVTTDTEVVYNVGDKYNYILQDGVFKKATGAMLHAGKAYLSTDYQATSRELQIVFEGEEEATGIADVKSQKEEGGFFNLSGQRVTKPTKGLYIINGKKMIVK